MPKTSLPQIMVLPPEEARRIAAGEVVDRPAALVREFLDNAIDAGAANIEISIEEGGCKKVEISDDGSGMSREDLEICYLAHATSKIRGLDDLQTARSLGFRGEALAAAAAMSRLEIITSSDGREAWHLQIGPGADYPPDLVQTRRTKGTTVKALSLFENAPARKKFLKREGSEAGLCRQAFLDKALAFNNINFRYVQDGKLKDFLPAVSSKKERFAAALLQTAEAGFMKTNFLHEINVTGSGFTAAVVIGGPELYRNDRRQMFIFANGRRVNDYALLQAMEYGAQGWFPNGTHPVGAVYVEIDPALADFNIHPAKREVRFRDAGAVHHAVSGGIKNFFHTHFLSNSRGEKKIFEEHGKQQNFDSLQMSHNTQFHDKAADYFNNAKRGVLNPLANKTKSEEARNNFDYSAFPETSPRRLREISPAKDFNIEEMRRIQNKFHDINYANESPPIYGEARLAGRVFGLFILIEWGDKLYIIDQHAAHERILYNRFLSQPIPKQPLLSPIPFRTESEDEDNFLEAKREELSRLGIDIEKDEDAWRIEALPADWRLCDADTIKEILELRTAGENMAEKWAATLCCRAAIKDGDYPDDAAALALGKEALELPEPRCPHGRPIWTEISRDALFKAVRRS